ncbi:MAG: C13 family peptidase, partial [Burkholderiales bacterium]
RHHARQGGLILRLLLCSLAAVSLVHAAGGEPEAITPDGGRYFGPLVNGRLEGHGRVEWQNGKLYEGAFAGGLYNGRGTLTGADGRRYTGDFVDGQFQGRGRFEAASGEIYEGDFEKGEFTGRGTYARPDGARYRGTFLKWRPHGEGRYVDANGDIYEGEFKNGAFEGRGTLIYAQPRPDGRTEARGEWRNWQLVDDPEPRAAGLAVETALMSQRPLLDQALGALLPGRPGAIDMYLLAVGGDGTQEVFRREVEYVRTLFDERYGTRGRSVALVNSRNTLATAPMASVSSVGEALKAIAARMNRDEDILFLFLTSHGSRKHALVMQQNYLPLRDLPASELAKLVKETGIHWKVIVVSACYSGGFIEPLKDDSTLIITAARHDRTSFGCADENDFTYFGRAFFKEALPASRSFEEAFAKADALVSEWEKKEQPKEPRSLPQMQSTAAIAAQLRRWWSERPVN